MQLEGKVENSSILPPQMKLGSIVTIKNKNGERIKDVNGQPLPQLEIFENYIGDIAIRFINNSEDQLGENFVKFSDTLARLTYGTENPSTAQIDKVEQDIDFEIYDKKKIAKAEAEYKYRFDVEYWELWSETQRLNFIAIAYQANYPNTKILEILKSHGHTARTVGYLIGFASRMVRKDDSDADVHDTLKYSEKYLVKNKTVITEFEKRFPITSPSSV